MISALLNYQAMSLTIELEKNPTKLRDRRSRR